MTTKYIKPGAIIACAVSTPKQAQQGESLADQEKINRSLADKMGAEVLLVTKWTHSRRVGTRNDFEEAIAFIANHPNRVKYYFVRSIDRFTRAGSSSYENMKQELARRGVELVDSYAIIQQPKNALEHLGVEYSWSKSSPSEVTELVFANQSKNEVSNILIRTIGKQIELTREGYQTGVPNDGYINKRIFVGNKKRTIQIPDSERSKFYIRMFELRALNALSDLEIVDTLNAEGFKTKISNKWDKDKEKIVGQRGGILLTVKQLQRIIRNPIYCGIICEKWTGNLPVKAQWEGLVSIDTFNQANHGKIYIKELDDESIEIIQNYNPNRTKKKNKDNPLFPYKFILCPTCKKPLVGSCPKGKSGKGFPTYHCSRKHKYIGVNKLRFEDTIENFFKNLKFCPEYLESLHATLINKYREKQKEIAFSSSDISQHIADMESEMATKIDGITRVKNPVIIAEIERQVEALEQQIKYTRNKRARVEITEDDIGDFIKQARYLMEHPGEIVMDQEDSHIRQGLANLYFEEMPTYNDILNGTPKLHWIFETSKPNADTKNQLAALRGIEPRYQP